MTRHHKICFRDSIGSLKRAFERPANQSFLGFSEFVTGSKSVQPAHFFWLSVGWYRNIATTLNQSLVLNKISSKTSFVDTSMSTSQVLISLGRGSTSNVRERCRLSNQSWFSACDPWSTEMGGGQEIRNERVEEAKRNRTDCNRWSGVRCLGWGCDKWNIDWFDLGLGRSQFTRSKPHYCFPSYLSHASRLKTCNSLTGHHYWTSLFVAYNLSYPAFDF